MRILHLTTLVLSGALGTIMGIFISPSSHLDSSIFEGLVLGVSVGITTGLMITFTNLGFLPARSSSDIRQKVCKKLTPSRIEASCLKTVC